MIFRLGGDEFAIFAPRLTQRKVCEEHFNRLRESLKDVDLIMDRIISIEVSIGCTIYESVEIDFEILYKQSDDLLYQAKNNGTGQVVVEEIRTLNACAV